MKNINGKLIKVNGNHSFTQIKDELAAFTEVEKDELTDAEKIDRIEVHISGVLKTLGLNLKEDGLKETPRRVAKMYVREMFSGLNIENFPKISLFKNTYGYSNMLIEKDIVLYSQCEHHLVPIIGKVHVGYFPGEEVIGLSKINRLVQFFARKPQVQERLTIEIAEELKEILAIEDVAVFIEADHLCVASRGIQDVKSRTNTSYYGGRFLQDSVKNEFLNNIR